MHAYFNISVDKRIKDIPMLMNDTAGNHSDRRYKTKLIKLRKQLDDLVNSDRRIKYAKECLNYLTNINIRLNRNQDLFAFKNKIFSLEKNKFIKAASTQFIKILIMIKVKILQKMNPT